MKPSRKDLLLWLCALTASLVLLAMTRSSTAQPLPPRPGDASRKPTISFEASFADFRQNPHLVSCEISAAGHRQELGSVGFNVRQRVAWLNPRMYEQALREMPEVNRKLAILGCAITVSPGGPVPPGHGWWIQTSLSCSRDDQNFAEEARASVQEWLRNLDREKDEILKPFYESHNVRLDGGKLDINYAAVIQRATPLLAGCARVLLKEGENKLDANLFTSFLQQLEYVKLGSPKGEVHVHDFLVPTQVLVEKRGDCDSKSAAFCALWRNYSNDVILLVSDTHAIIGYKAPANTHLPTYPIGLSRYVPCDVAGVTRLQCGTVPPGNYRPILING